MAARSFFVGVLAIGTLSLSSAPAEAWWANDLVVKNGGSRYFYVCESAASETVCGGTVRYLAPGKDTKATFGWVDTDMIKITARCELQEWTYSGGTQRWIGYGAAGQTSRWIKVPGNFGKTMSFRLVC